MKTKILLAAAVLGLSSGVAVAESYPNYQILLGSYHSGKSPVELGNSLCAQALKLSKKYNSKDFKCTTAEEFESFNPGFAIYSQAHPGFFGGMYRNSTGDPVVTFGKEWYHTRTISTTTALAFGYAQTPILPLLSLNLSTKNLRASIAPYTTVVESGVTVTSEESGEKIAEYLLKIKDTGILVGFSLIF